MNYLAPVARLHSMVLRAAELRSTGDDPLGPTDIDPDDVRDAACDVTASNDTCRPPTTQPDRDPPDPPNLPNASGVGALGQLLILLLVLALVAALVWFGVRFFRGERVNVGDDEAEDRDESIDEVVDERVIDHDTPPDRWRRRAAEFRGQGDYRESVRCEYRALVGDLARAGHVDEIPGRTSGEEREQIAELAPGLGERGRDVARQFDAAADIFDGAWFNDLEVTATDDASFVTASQSVLEVVLSSSGPRFGGRRA